MKDFVFSNTTKVYFGKDQLHHLSERDRKVRQESPARLRRRFYQEDRLVR